MSSSTIQYLSDLHLEFPKNNQFIKNNPIKQKGDILILAGDVVPFAILNKHQDFFSYLADNFEMTYWIPGNHEYYYEDIADRSGSFYEQIRPNVVLLNNSTVQIQDTKLIFSTLWFKISPINSLYVQENLSDFHVILYKGRTLTTDIYNNLHEESSRFLKQELQTQHHGKTVVITHHVPTYINYPDIYKGSKLNECFAVELFETIESSAANYWIYGHSHFNTPEFSIGDTKMVTNQMGYVHQRQHLLFNANATFVL